jgi:hypothetical protein
MNAISNEDLRAPLMAFLRGYYVPVDEKAERRMALGARNYNTMGEDLFQACVRGGGGGGGYAHCTRKLKNI